MGNLTDTSAHKVYQFDDWQVVPAANELIRKDESFTLEPRVMRALCVLIERQQQVVEREQLIKAVWPDNVIVSDQSVTQLLGNLRKVLQDSARSPKYIQTIPKRGYRFIAACETSTHVTTQYSETAETAQPHSPSVENTAPQPPQQSAALVNEHTQPVQTSSLSFSTKQPLNAAAMKKLNRIVLIVLAIASLIYGLVMRELDTNTQQASQGTTQVPANSEKALNTGEAAVVLPSPKVSPLTNSPGVERFPTVSPDGKWMAFSWEDYQTETNIFIKSLEAPSAKRIQLTFDGARELKAVWSPDSSHIAFARFTGENECAIVTMNIETRKQRFIAQCSSSQFSAESLEWSVDNQLYFKASDKNVIRKGLSRVRIALDMPKAAGSVVSKLIEPIPCQLDCQFDDMDISVAPDNSNFVLTRQVSLAGQDLYLYPTDLSTQEKRITYEGVQILGHAFSEDSRSLFYVSLKEGAPALWRYDIANNSHQKIEMGSMTPTYPARIPQQNSLLFTRQERQFYISQVKLTQGDTQQAPIVQSYASNFDPAMSKNGKELAYTSGVSGKSEVWIVNLETMQYEQITESEVGSLSPAWSADGSKLVYVNYENRQEPRLVTYNIESKKPHYVDTRSLQAIWGPQFSDNNTEILVSGVKNNVRRIWSINLKDNTVKPETSAGGFIVRQDPANVNLLFFSKEQTAGLWLVDRQTKQEHLVLAELQDTHPLAWTVTAEHIIYLYSTADHDFIKQFDRQTKEISTLATLPRKSAARYTTGGISLRSSGDNQYLLFVHNGILQADIFKAQF